MGKIKKHIPVKLFIGFISSDTSLIEETLHIFIRKFGDIDLKSPYLRFVHTSYYNPEFGSNLFRFFAGFSRLVQADNFASIKIFTNNIEKKFSKDNKRKVNIDPGYIDLGKVILATTKDYSHRLYLRNGIYAEVTLHFTKGIFTSWPWTYSDYKSDEYLDFFNKLRRLYRGQIQDAR